MKKTVFIIGSDPEIFVKEIATGLVGSIIGVLGGTKDEPIKITNNCAVQEDNILAEFNIPPVSSKEEFIGHIDHCKDYISTLAAAKGLALYYSSSEQVPDSAITDDKAKVFGCAPSINIITEQVSAIEMNELSEEAKKLRTSGFHIHFGYDEPTDEINERIVLAFELMTSIPLNKFDNDKFHRRQLYGRFGDCRFKDYGVECRSLGGYFLKDHYTLSLVWDKIQETINLVNSDVPTSKIKDMVEYCLGDNDIVIEENVLEVQKELNTTLILQK
ncbi:COOH.NH2 ligase [Cellulophaga phage phi14:2]|uniref:Uncharacterized protein n=1 Tax=Cellulophaga phage phi14:2 TaxID=1327990 RepID=S0A3X2_9CAUD|nr:COOH.NH2 ligase [Cellulophaga phage phi14:2]AGO48928.1 hypothetical protein Phi14:2_gp050 [Cellulophaga phage phi14:2]